MGWVKSSSPKELKQVDLPSQYAGSKMQQNAQRAQSLLSGIVREAKPFRERDSHACFVSSHRPEGVWEIPTSPVNASNGIQLGSNSDMHHKLEGGQRGGGEEVNAENEMLKLAAVLDCKVAETTLMSMKERPSGTLANTRRDIRAQISHLAQEEGRLQQQQRNLSAQKKRLVQLLIHFNLENDDDESSSDDEGLSCILRR
jgi:hypothetical protein